MKRPVMVFSMMGTMTIGAAEESGEGDLELFGFELAVEAAVVTFSPVSGSKGPKMASASEVSLGITSLWKDWTWTFGGVGGL